MSRWVGWAEGRQAVQDRLAGFQESWEKSGLAGDRGDEGSVAEKLVALEDGSMAPGPRLLMGGLGKTEPGMSGTNQIREDEKGICWRMVICFTGLCFSRGG